MFKVSLLLSLVLLASCGGSSSAVDAASPVPDAPALDPASASPSALKGYVRLLSQENTPRSNTDVATLDKIAALITAELESFGYAPTEQVFQADGATYRNISALIGPSGGKRIVVGAHYDAAGALPGADDNASGVAGLLEFARLLQSVQELAVQVEIVAFSLEEPPNFGTPDMGSAKHAASVTPDDVQFMISLEMIGYYDDAPGTQTFPEIPGIPESALVAQYGNVGNFIALVGRPEDQPYLARFKTEMNASSDLKAESLAIPPGVQGVAWSDHFNYWDRAIPAFMVTDSAMFRNTAYHTAGDTWDRLDYDRMAKVVNGLRDGIVSVGQAPIQ